MYKNAGIKTIREAITRLMNGEVFYLQKISSTFRFDDSDKTASPFRCNDDCTINSSFHDFADWQIKTDWRDNVSEENPVLCWVWDRNVDRQTIALIYKFNKDSDIPYVNKKVGGFMNASPLTKEEALKYIVEE